MLDESDKSYHWVITALMLVLLFCIPYMLQIHRTFVDSNPSYSWWAWLYTIYPQGIELTSPWSILGKSYDTVLYLLFIVAFDRYYNGNTSQKTVKTLGILSILPRLLPTISNLFLSLFSFGGNHLYIGVPLPLVVILGFVVLRLKPLPPQENLWLEE